jgi:tubulin-specific chaperone D
VFLPALAEAYLESLRQTYASNKPLKNVALLVPLSAAICELLYTFCKVRGEKVVVRFLNAETRNLELLLSAIEAAESTVSDRATDIHPTSTSTPWTWEERYICLLWLSHLLLAPFDLATISSAGTASNEKPEIQGLIWPDDLPGVTLRVVPLAVKYLASAGKERDAAKALLVRISMRKDMQELGLMRALVQWALSNLQSSAPATANSTYSSIGTLSYLGGLLVSSASTSDMNSYLTEIFRAVQAISEEENPAFKSIRSSALARKIIIKVMRAIAVIALKLMAPPAKSSMEGTEIVEATIGHLLEALADNDTPVRLAASKALSIITLKLPPVMASQVVDAVLDSLTHNVLWVASTLRRDGSKTRDLSAVNPLEWHGLILTLSHLLYRRSPPPESLSEILSALLIGLSFERRSTSGSSVGTNIRDAACFGIWALARRYMTPELQKVSIPSAYALNQDGSSHVIPSVIQVLAIELVVSASLDPAGNIRRGASAALQELIGRHPDTVAEGIAVVQVVDYHAVALRSRAMLEVAPKAASLSKYYQDALLSALLSWRGVGDGDATSRRNAAIGIGLLAQGLEDKRNCAIWRRLIGLMTSIESQLKSLMPRESDQRHGLLLSMAAVISSIPDILKATPFEVSLKTSPGLRETISQIFQIVTAIMEAAKSTMDRRTEMVAEGASRVILATVAVLRIDLKIRAFFDGPRIELSEDDMKREKFLHISDPLGAPLIPASDALFFINQLDVWSEHGFHPQANIVILSEELLMIWLRRTEKEVVDAATEAVASWVWIIDSQQRGLFVGKCISEVLEVSRARLIPGYFFALAAVFSVVAMSQQDDICNAILHRWQATSDIESKVIILQCLTRGSLLDSHASRFIKIIAESLDDYTTDGRGDIGSLVRAEALKAARIAFRSIPWDDIKDENDGSEPWFRQLDTFSTLYGKVLRLSAEKLDRVRIEAQQTLAQACRYDV